MKSKPVWLVLAALTASCFLFSTRARSLCADQAQPRDFVIVCEDGGAGAYEAFPDVCRLTDGRLMAVFYAGHGHVSLPYEKFPKGGQISYCTSSDEGKTWSTPGLLYDGPNDDRDPSIAQLADGRLLCTFFTLIPTKKPGKNPWWTTRKDGEWPFTCRGTTMVESSDLGKTWSKPRLIYSTYKNSSPVRVLSDGRLALGLCVAAVGFSDDKGKTWNKAVDIDPGDCRNPSETDVTELQDGSLYAVMRTDGCYSVSNDRGNSWTVAKPIGFTMHCPYLHRVGDIILLGYRLTPETYTTGLRYSLDECKTWSENVLIDSVRGAYPSMVTLKDGSVLVVYYEEGPGSNIRAKKFRATKSGIEWLKF